MSSCWAVAEKKIADLKHHSHDLDYFPALAMGPGSQRANYSRSQLIEEFRGTDHRNRSHQWAYPPSNRYQARIP